MKLHQQITNELIGQEEIEMFIHSGFQRSIQRFLSEGRSLFTILSPFKRQLVAPEQYSSQHQQILLL